MELELKLLCCLTMKLMSCKTRGLIWETTPNFSFFVNFTSESSQPPEHHHTKGVKCKYCQEFWTPEQNFTSIQIHEEFCVLFQKFVTEERDIMDELPTGRFICNICDKKKSSSQDKVLRHIYKNHYTSESASPEERKWAELQVPFIMSNITLFTPFILIMVCRIWMIQKT